MCLKSFFFLFSSFCTWFLPLLPGCDALKLTQGQPKPTWSNLPSPHRWLPVFESGMWALGVGALPSKQSCLLSTEEILVNSAEVWACTEELNYLYKWDPPWRKTRRILLINDWMHVTCARLFAERIHTGLHTVSVLPASWAFGGAQPKVTFWAVFWMSGCPSHGHLWPAGGSSAPGWTSGALHTPIWVFAFRLGNPSLSSAPLTSLPLALAAPV